MRNPKVLSQSSNSVLTPPKKQAKKGAASGRETSLPLEAGAAVILHKSLARLGNLTVLGAINSLHDIRLLIEGHPSLKAGVDSIKQIGAAYSELHGLCAQVAEAIHRRELRDDYTQAHENRAFALWENVIQPALQWKPGQYSHLLYSLGPELHCAAALVRYNSHLQKETAAMLRLAGAIDALESFEEEIEEIANPKSRPPELPLRQTLVKGGAL